MRVYRSDAGWQERGKAHQAIPRHDCIPAEPAAVSPGKIIVPRIVIGGVILEQPAGGGIGAASVGPRVCGRVRRDLGLSARQHLVRRDESDGAVAACLQGGSDADVEIDSPLSRTLSTSLVAPQFLMKVLGMVCPLRPNLELTGLCWCVSFGREVG